VGKPLAVMSGNQMVAVGVLEGEGKEVEMCRGLALICLAAILLSSCAPLTTTAADPAIATQPTAAPAATVETRSAGDCPVTPPIKDQPPDDPNADSFGLAYWYINADRTLWAGPLPEGQSWRAGDEKVIWIRPQGTQLVITGHRLDAEVPPLHADIPCCYNTGFQVTGLIFPTEGCWEVSAKAGDNKLHFVTKVAPAEHSATGSSCKSLADAVKQSDAIVSGRVTDTETDGYYTWNTVSELQTWKRPSGWGGIGDRISLLQDLQAGPELEKNGRYVLFLQYEPWRLVCAQQSVVEQKGDQAIPVGHNSLWPGGTMADLETEVDRLVRMP
jgi:hypothetical protein